MSVRARVSFGECERAYERDDMHTHPLVRVAKYYCDFGAAQCFLMPHGKQGQCAEVRTLPARYRGCHMDCNLYNKSHRYLAN